MPALLISLRIIFASSILLVANDKIASFIKAEYYGINIKYFSNISCLEVSAFEKWLELGPPYTMENPSIHEFIIQCVARSGTWLEVRSLEIAPPCALCFLADIDWAPFLCPPPTCHSCLRANQLRVETTGKNEPKYLSSKLWVGMFCPTGEKLFDTLNITLLYICTSTFFIHWPIGRHLGWFCLFVCFWVLRFELRNLCLPERCCNTEL